VLFPLRRIDPVPDQRLDLRPGLDAATRFLDSSQVLRPPLLEQEPYAYLCNYVGASTQALLARDGHAASSALGVAAASLMHLRHDARVVGAVPGIYGSLPFGSSAYLTCTDADSNANLWRKPFELERLQADRIVHGVRTPRLVPEAVYTPLLLDARELLPFAGTWGRVDDQYFLMLLKAIAGNIAFALVPALLGHADHAPRRRLERAREALLLDRNAFIAFVFAQSGATLASSDRTLRLAAVGRICAELAAADDAELALRILSWRSNMIGHLCAHLAAALEQFPHAPPAWRTHVQAILTANRTALELPTLDAQDLTAYRAGLQQAAAAAELWPVIWQKMLDQPLLERLPRL
jgi:hypothetical protein